MRILLVLCSLAMASCALPDKPEGRLCTHYEAKQIAICNDIKTSKALPDVPISQTDKWVMMDPKTFKNLLDYIDLLRRRAESKSANISATTQDVKTFQSKTFELKKKTLERR